MEAGFRLSQSRVAIVGLGLMGASLAMDLRGHCGEIIGTSRSADTLQYALAQHIVDRVGEFGPGLECELMVLAAPVRTIIRQLQSLQESGPKDAAAHKTVVIDLGSTKGQIAHAMQGLPGRYDPIGGHPMCGKEVAGIRHAEPGLYRSKIFVLTPLERTSPDALALVEELVEVVGAIPIVLPPEKQDALVALISHLPYIAASALMTAALSQDEPALWQVAASGFRDTTRLAASDLTMMMDILLTNRDAILDALNLYQLEIGQVAALLREEDEAALRNWLTRSQSKRMQLFRQEP